MKIVDPLVIEAKQLGSYLDHIPTVGFTGVRNVRFDCKSGESGARSIRLAEANEWVENIRGIIKDEDEVGHVHVAVVIDPFLQYGFLPTRDGGFEGH